MAPINLPHLWKLEFTNVFIYIKKKLRDIITATATNIGTDLSKLFNRRWKLPKNAVSK